MTKNPPIEQATMTTRSKSGAVAFIARSAGVTEAEVRRRRETAGPQATRTTVPQAATVRAKVRDALSAPFGTRQRSDVTVSATERPTKVRHARRAHTYAS